MYININTVLKNTNDYGVVYILVSISIIVNKQMIKILFPTQQGLTAHG